MLKNYAQRLQASLLSEVKLGACNQLLSLLQLLLGVNAGASQASGEVVLLAQGSNPVLALAVAGSA